MEFTITATAYDKPGVLYRMADLFLRRKVNIDSLTVSKTHRPGISRFTLVVGMDEETVNKICKQILRIVEFIEVEYHTDERVHTAEMAFVKLPAQKDRDKLDKLLKKHQARVVYESGYLLVEKSGTEGDIDKLVSDLMPRGIVEIVRSGRIAAKK